MVDESIIKSVKKYLLAVNDQSVKVSFGVIFGSQAKGNTTKWSDIDLLVVSPDFDPKRERNKISQLWRIAGKTDSRIEPIACGEKQWLEDDSSAIIEIARREGEIVRIEIESG
jgi:predicted nucleotidyltransferase